MKIEIKSLYDLEYGHIILPSELIANAKLPNYESVKFSSIPSGLNVECICFLEDNSRMSFNYYFDKDDRLMKLIANDGTYNEVLFDREVEIKKLRNKIRIEQQHKLNLKP
ncbi:hypothetical protein ACVNS2_07950 [Paenibacillus caseinilyticus]|uniref:Uncharacterized protein n=1 Tax=Paenibacillus mucilaginosus K02 TaxID=997761 RepID=I0BE00_9BACL|nr:hypothetical protein [Paenibacillus mucilaginosus]AFH60597.1 hypothetical protein B2K_07655 [Paenibacillus mucilaginosus K02]